MGGSSQGTSSQTSTTTLPAAQQANVNTILQDSLAYYNSGGAKYYGGSTVAQTTPEQQQARQMATDYATGAGQQSVNAAQSANNYWLNPKVLTDYSSIPGYDANRQKIITGATQTLTDSTLPVIRDEAILNGQYGGTSQQIGEALATSRTNEAIAGQLSDLDLGLYNTNAGMQNNALNRSTEMYNLGLSPSDTLESVGSLNRQDEQQNIDADVKKWNFEQMAPLLNLQALQGLTGSAGQYGGTTTTTGTQGVDDGGQSTLTTVAGLAMMAIAMY